MAEPLTILIAARNEEERIGTTVEELRRQFPAAEIVVADDGSRDATAAVAEAAGALVVRLPHRGKGQALTLGERAAATATSCSATPTSAATCGRSSTATPTSRSPRSPAGRAAASGSRSRRRAG